MENISENDQKYDLAKLYKRDVELANDFIFYGSYDYGEIEQKIIYYLTMKVDTNVGHDENGNPVYKTIYPISYKRFCAATGMPRNGQSYEAISIAIKKLTLKTIEIIRPDKAYTDLRFLLRRTEFYNPNNRYAVVEIDERIMPFLVNKKANFTKNPAQHVLRLRGTYPQRVYMYIKACMDREKGQEIKIFRSKYGRDYKEYDDDTKRLFKELKEYLDTKEYRIVFELSTISTLFKLPKSLRYVSRLNEKVIKSSKKSIHKFGEIYIEETIEDKKNDSVICVARYKTPLELYETNRAIEDELKKIKDYGEEEENNYDKSIFSIENGVFLKGGEIYQIEDFTNDTLDEEDI
jgi:Initiator Replication protein.